jgi:hypothetical protein
MRVPESSTLRVEIADAGGTQVELPHRVAEELRALAIHAVVVPLEAIVQTSADAVILRGDAPGVLGILRSLRDDGPRPDTPVLLLGTPEGTGPFQEGPGFGAEHVLAKDASAARIAEVLGRITGRKKHTADPSRERKVEHTLELSQRGEAGGSDWQVRSGFLGTPEDRPSEGGAASDRELPSDPPGVSRRRGEDARGPEEVSQIVAAPELSAVFESHHGDLEAPRRRAGSSPGERRADSVAPGTGSHPGTGSGVSSPGSVPGTSQLFVVASISDELRKILYDADRRVFADRPPIDVSLPRGEDAARDLVPDEFVEVFSLAVDEPERADLELTFVGVAGAKAEDAPRARPAPDPEPPSAAEDADEQRPKTSPGTPTSMSRRPPEPDAGTRSSADAQIAPPRPYVSEAPRASEGPAAREEAFVRPSQPPPRVALVSSERGDLAPLGAFALLGQLALGRLDVVLSLRVEDKPVVLTLARGELAQVSGEGFVELRRRALHRLLSASVGAGQATDASRGEPTFALERASRLAEEAVLAEVLLHARGAVSIEPRVLDVRAEGPSRLTQRTLASTMLEVSRRALSADRVANHFLPGPEDPTVSRLERLSRLEVARVPNLERVLDAIEAPRELAWLLRRETATQPTSLASLVAAAPDEPGLVAAVFVVAQLGGLAIHVLSEAASLAHTDLDARAEKSIGALRERADRADYFEVLGIPRDSDGSAVVDAHYRLRAELLAWPLADLGLARLEADRMRILAVLDDAADVLADARARRRYARGLEIG